MSIINNCYSDKELKKVIVIISLIVYCCIAGCSRSLSFMEMNRPERVLQQGKWQSYSTRHFDFHYRPDSKSSRMMDIIAARQENNYTEVLRLFHLNDYGYRIMYFIFENIQDYDEVTGAANFSSTYEIGNYGSVYAIDNDTLSNVNGKHEITHFIVDNYFGFGAPGPFKWLIGEGLAVWSENEWNRTDLYEYAAKKLISNEISSPYFIVSHPEAQKIQQNIYPMAGAFTKYMVETYGLPKYLNLYQRGFNIESFRLIFGRSFYDENLLFEQFLIKKLHPLNKIHTPSNFVPESKLK